MALNKRNEDDCVTLSSANNNGYSSSDPVKHQAGGTFYWCKGTQYTDTGVHSVEDCQLKPLTVGDGIETQYWNEDKTQQITDPEEISKLGLESSHLGPDDYTFSVRYKATSCGCESISGGRTINVVTETSAPDGKNPCPCEQQTCDDDAKTLNSDTCECECTHITDCGGNETFDHDSCTCECPVGSSAPCSGGQVLLVDNCECGCSQLNPQCIDGEIWDAELCSCTLINQNILKGQTEFNLSRGDEYLNGTLTISDGLGFESHSIIQLGSLIISEPGATRNFSDATISASPASASSQSDPHIKTFFGESFEL
tara:strand:+ start:400 stop:1335 length:936 start_codon:yes stop_codon:yes gene_type:complete